MIELTGKRQENSKRYKLDDRKEQLVISIGAIHYKDDYADKRETWKDIDLTWEDNKITKAPYELTVNGRKSTIRNKKTGEISTIEALDSDVEVVLDFTRVRFARVLNSDRDSPTAKFRVTGNFIARASDEDGELPVDATLKDGILTETLHPNRPVKYPVRIDPTYQVGAGTDDVWRRLDTASLSLTADLEAGAQFSSFQYGSGMRFTGVAIPNGEPIIAAKLTLRASLNRSGTTVNVRISAEDVDDAITFANDGGAFDTRYAARTTVRVDWDAIPAWTADVDYDSPEIKTVIQEIVDRPGWAQGAIVTFWEDFDDRSTHASSALRTAYSYDGSAEFAPKLVITIAVAAKRGWWSK